MKSWAERHSFRFTPGQFYRVKLGIGPYWRETSQLIFVDSPIALVAINGVGPLAPAQTFDIPGPAHSIILNGGSICAARYFVSIELSDQWMDRKGGEFGQWPDQDVYNQYGPITAFNVKRWAEHHYFHFYPGQYYRLKLATGPDWSETVVLLKID